MSARRETSAILEPLQTGDSPPAATTVAVRSMPVGSPRGAIFHLDLLRSLFLHRWLAIGVFATGLALTLAYVLRMETIYTAHAVVYVQPTTPAHAGDPAQHKSSDESIYQSFIQRQVKTGADILMGALHKLPAGVWRHADESDQSAAERLGRALKVTRVGPYQFSIGARAGNAGVAAQVANAAASSFVETAAQNFRPNDSDRVDLLREERDRLQKELAADRAEQADLKKMLSASAVGTSAVDLFSRKIGEVTADLGKARTASDEAFARLIDAANVDARSFGALDAEANRLIAADPGLENMKVSLDHRRAVLVAQMARQPANQPAYKPEAEELAQIDASLESMMKDMRVKASAQIEQRLRSDLEQTSAAEAQLNIQLAKLTVAAGSTAPRLQRFNDLTTDILRLQSRLAAVDDQLHHVGTGNKAPVATYIVAPAAPPTYGSESGVIRNALLLVLASLLLAIFAAVGAHNFDPRVYIAADVERVLGVGLMAQIPDFGQVSEAAGEEYMLRLAGAMEHACQQGSLKSCIFTGVAVGAGVTTLATRITGMLEAMGQTTVLVDAAGSAPALPVSEYGIHSEDLAETHSAEILKQMTTEADPEAIVLADTAPLLVSAETEYLARFVDTAIIIIESGVTTRAQLREVSRTLRRLQVTAAGFVLNRISIRDANPAFRQSVQGVERHLRSHGRTQTRSSTRTRTSSRPHKATPAAPSADLSAPAGVPPETHPNDAPIASTGSVASSAAQGGASPISATFRAPGSLHARPLRGRGEPTRSVAVQPPLASPATGAHTDVAGQSPEGAVDRGAVAADPFRSPASWAGSEQMPGGGSDADGEDLPFSAAARLGGLRKLVASLGLKSLQREAQDKTRLEESEFRVEREAGSSADSGGQASDSPGSTVVADSSLEGVVAQPEFIRPRPGVEVEKEKEPIRPVPTPVRKETADEIETLPSWRGQYRKRRYPPV